MNENVELLLRLQSYSEIARALVEQELALLQSFVLKELEKQDTGLEALLPVIFAGESMTELAIGLMFIQAGELGARQPDMFMGLAEKYELVTKGTVEEYYQLLRTDVENALAERRRAENAELN